MFDFLKKPTHHHPQSPAILLSSNQNQPSLPSPKYKETIEIKVIPQLIDSPHNQNKQIKNNKVKKHPQITEIHLAKQVQQTLKDLLLEAKNSVHNMKANEIIQKEMKEKQQTAFIRYTSQNQHDYLDKLYEKAFIKEENLKLGLENIISGTIGSISNEIENSEYTSDILKNKNLSRQEPQVQQLAQVNLIKLKEGQISSKVGQLKMQLHYFQDPKIASKAKQIVQKQTYNQESQKAKQIQKFIEKKKSQRQEIQQRKKQQIQRQKIKDLEQKIAKQKQIEKAKQEKHAKLLEKLQAKQIIKQKKQQQLQFQKKKFANFLKQYKNTKPLFQRKVQEQIQRQIEQKKLRYQKMSQRKGRYNPISFSEIQEFQQKYLELKRQQQEKKKIQTVIKKDEQKFRIEEMKDKHYKGKYRYLVLEEMVNTAAKSKEEQFAKRILLEKKRAYSVDIKEKHKPKIDQNKRLEIQKFVSKTERKRKYKNPKRVRINSSNPYTLQTIDYFEDEQQEVVKDPKKEGDKNMKIFKQYIHEKIKRGQIKRPETFSNQVSTLIPPIDYLRSQRENRQTSNSSFIHQSLDASSRIRKIKSQAKGDLGVFKFKALQLDQQTRRQQMKLKYSQHTPNEQKQLEQNYLASIQAKLQILNNIK